MAEDTPTGSAPSGRGLLIAIVVVVVVVIVVVAAIFAGPLLFPGEAEPVIGTILPITGQLAVFGPGMARAANLAVFHINDNGGLFGGTDIRLIQEDSQTQASAGVLAARKLIDLDGAVAIIGAAASRVSTPINEGVTTPGRIIMISPASTSPAFTAFNADLALQDRYFFRTAPTDILQGAAGAIYAFNDKGWRNMAILARADPYGTGLASVFAEKFVELGGTITKRVDYNPDATSYTSELTEIFNSNPEAIYWVAFPGEGEIIMKNWWANDQWRDPAWFWSEGTFAQAFLDTLNLAGIDVSGMEGTAPTTASAAADNFDVFEALYKADTSVDIVLFEPHTYDAIFLVALAMERGGSARPEVIRDNLQAVAAPPGTVVTVNEWQKAKDLIAAGTDINYQGASGFADFDDLGDVTGDYEVWVIDPDLTFGHVKNITEQEILGSPPLTVSSSPALPAGLFILPSYQLAARD